MTISETENIVVKKERTTGQNIAFDDDVFVGRNKAIAEILGKIDLIGPSQAAVLITGESGTGKEVIAKIIHHRGSHHTRPFIAVNAAALPKDVVENELFGHEKEAFTGAISKKPGCFELAHGGTLFLDEIAEMSAQTQAKLLRAIENKSFRRLGGKDEIDVDVRIIAATNREIPKVLKSGELREDLFYRLSVIEIPIPALRERRDDIPLLTNYFLSLLCSKYRKSPKQFTDESIQMLMEFDWPGNVRELRNLIERMVIVCPDELITSRYLPSRVSHRKQPLSCITIPLGTSIQKAERMIIDQTLAYTGNNKSAASRILGLTRKTLRKKLSR